MPPSTPATVVCNIPSTQYGHRMCIRLILPHPEHLFSDVMSFNPLPAMNRCRFLRYDVFFFGTALRMPSQMSANDGNEGRDNEGIASAPKGVAKDCERRCRNGTVGKGRTAPLRPGSSVCHSGGSGRARAIIVMYRCIAWCAGLGQYSRCSGGGVVE